MRKFFMSALAVVALAITTTVQTVAQESFAYQAVIRDSEGNLITEKEVGLRFSLMYGGEAKYVETQKSKTNQYGNISVMIGDGEKSTGDFAKVPWETLDITLKVEVDPAGGDKYITLGETKISPVPYAMYARTSSGVAKTNTAAKGSETLFEVNDRNGNPVFAVTDNGIIVYVDDAETADKMRRSGFLVTGREATKGEPAQEYFSVTTDGTTIYVNGSDQSDKMRRSGFLVTGREATKEGADNRYMVVDENGTHVYVDASEDDKMRRSGFLVTGREATKDNYSDIFKIDGNLTTVYVDGDDNSKMRRSGFLVTGREATKLDRNANAYMVVTTDSTRLSTKALTITSAGDTSFALQKQDDRLWFNGDIAVNGEFRQKRPFNEKDWFKVYLSDTARRDNDLYDDEEFKSSELWSTIQNNYHGNYLQGYYEFSSDLSYTDENDVEHYHDYGYMILASVDEKGMVLPCRSNGKILFDTDGQETTILENAVVMVSSYYSSSSGTQLVVHPLAKLSDYIFDVALLNPYNNEPMYERYTVNLNSSKPFAGCQVTMMINDDADYSFLGRVTTSEGSNEQELVGNGYWLETSMVKNAVYGSTATLEALTVPEGMVFKCWLKKENSYSSYGYAYFSNPLQVVVDDDRCYYEAVFEPIPPIMVNGTNGNDEIGNGNTIPYKTLGRALKHIIDANDNEETYKIRLVNWCDDIAIGDSLNNKAAEIAIDLSYNKTQFSGSSSKQHVIDIATTVPVIVSGGTITRLSEDRVICVAGHAQLIIKDCYVDGNVDDINGDKGGAYVAKDGKLILDNSTIRHFYADNGGGVYLDGGELSFEGSSHIYNCQCRKSNIGKGMGGGVFATNGGKISLTNNENISYNTAQYGGGVFLTDNATIEFVEQGKSPISNNTAIQNGGGLYIDDGLNFTLNNGNNIESNAAQHRGGGVYVAQGGVFNLNDGYIQSNFAQTALYGGGGVYVDNGGVFNMNNGSVESNRSGTKLGSGVYVVDGGTFTMKDGAYVGGASQTVYLEGNSKINITGNLTYSWTPVTTIQLSEGQYSVGRDVLVSNGLNSNYSKFAVEKQTVTNTFGAAFTVEWIIDENGQLQKNSSGGSSSIDGALSGKFKVSDKKTIQFSKGNLEYLASTGEWRFAEDQLDKGDWTANTTNFSATNDGWINRFGYGTSGWNSGAQQYLPYSSDNDASKYLQTSMTGSNANADWGVYNAISNGGNTHGMWRTLTADEWDYLFNGRGTETDSHKKFGKARINLDGGGYVVGVIILPDDWTMTTGDFAAAGITFNPGANPSGGSQYVVYDANTLNETQWKLMERNGAVLLPALGYRKVDVVYNGETDEIVSSEIKIENGNYWDNYNGSNEPPIGYYWNANGSFVEFEKNTLQTNVEWNKSYGMCVRLVADVSGSTSANTTTSHSYVDLHLPSGKKWAKINLGYTGCVEREANYHQYLTSETIGNKYTWGGTATQGTFNSGDYTGPAADKYDSGDVLEPEDDAAYAQWGGNWRVPTDEDWKELSENCYWKYSTTDNKWNIYYPRSKTVDDETYENVGMGEHRTSGDGQSGDIYSLTYASVGDIVIPAYGSPTYWTSVNSGSSGNYDKAWAIQIKANNRTNYDLINYSQVYNGYYIRPVWVEIPTTVFYVSPDGNDDNNDGTRTKPFATIQQAASKMVDKYTRYTIFIDGELGGEQTLSGTIKARQITLRRGHKTDNIGGSIAISTSTPVVVENLAISTLTVGDEANVTLAGGAVVGNANVDGAFTLKNNASANVVLSSGKTITLDGSFNGTGVAVTPADYTEGTPLITKPNGYLITAEMFTVTPGNDGSQWKIDEDGLLQKDE